MANNELTLGVRIQINRDGSVRLLSETGREVQNIGQQAHSASQGVGHLQGSVRSLVTTLGPLVSIAAVIGIGKKIVEDVAAVQDLDTRLHGLTATAGDYAQTVSYINTVADEHHKNLNLLADSYGKLRNLENAGILTGQQTKSIFEGLSNAGSKYGASNDKIADSLYGFAQAASSGIVQADELHQVMDPMPGLLQDMDKAAGLASGGFNRLTKDGKVTSDMFINTLVAALHQYDGAAAAASDNINAKLTDISNSWTRLITALSDPVSDALTPFLNASKTGLDEVRQRIDAVRLAYEANKIETLDGGAAVMTVEGVNISAANAIQGAWFVVSSALHEVYTTIGLDGVASAAAVALGWLNSGDDIMGNVKSVGNVVIGVFVGVGNAIGTIFAVMATNIRRSFDNVTAYARATAADLAAAAQFDFKFSGVRAVKAQPLISGAGSEVMTGFKKDLALDYLGNLKAAVQGAALGYQKLQDAEYKASTTTKAAKPAVDASAVSHAAAALAIGKGGAAHHAAAGAAGSHKSAVDTLKKAVDDEMKSLNDQHNKLSLSERDYYASTLTAKNFNFAQKAMALAVWDSNKALEAQKAANDKGKTAMDTLIDQYNRLTLSARDYYAATLKKDGITPDKAGPLLKQYDKNRGLEAQKKSLDESRQAIDAYNKSLLSAKQNTGDLGAISSSVFDGALGGLNTLTGAFNTMMDSIKKNTEALSELHKKQAEIDNFQPVLGNDMEQYIKDVKLKFRSTEEYALEEKRLNNENFKESMSGIRQVAAATSAMFAENTSARKAFNVIALAASISERMADLAGLQIKAAAAVLEQGKGDPYTAFARIATMAAIVASILSAAGAGTFSFGGGGGAPAPVTNDGTGTVLGDKSAMSDSASKTYQLLKDIHASEYAELRGINRGVANLNSGIENVITRLFQAGGLTSYDGPLMTNQLSGLGSMIQTGSLIGKMDPISNFILSGIFGKTTQTVTGSGIATAAQPLIDAINGQVLEAWQYTIIKTTKKSWFSSSTKYSEMTGPLDDGVTQALTDVFQGMGQTMLELSKAFGGDTKAKIEAYVIPALKIDLQGLSGEEASKKLNGVISSVLDDMASSVFGEIIGQYQKLGEGMLETAVRIAAEVAVVTDALKTSGLRMGADAIAISDAVVQASGGLEEFQKQFGSYYDNFYNDTEKQNRLYSQLQGSLTDVLTVLPETREGYRKLIESLDLSNKKDRERYSLLISLSSAADQYYSGLEDHLKSLNDGIASAKSDLASAYKTEADALTTTINKFDDFAKSLKAFRDQLISSDLSTATPGEKYRRARGQFDSVMSRVEAGPGSTAASQAAYEKALTDLQAKAQAFLSMSRDYNASSAGYSTDYKRVLEALGMASTGADAAKTDAEKQLDTLKDSVKSLIDINTSVLSVRQAILAVEKAVNKLDRYQDQLDDKRIKAKADIADTKQVQAKKAVYNKTIGDVSVNSIATQLANDRGIPINHDFTQGVASDWYQWVSRIYGKFDPKLSAEDWEARRAIADAFIADHSVNGTGNAKHDVMWYIKEARKIDGSHAGGLERVPFDGYRAELHKDERVLTAKEANEYRFLAGLSGLKTGGNPSAGAEQKALIEQLQKQNEKLEKVVDELKKQNEQLKENGKTAKQNMQGDHAAYVLLHEEAQQQTEHLEALVKHARLKR